MEHSRPGQGALGSRDIAQLLAVADHGSIRRAADALGMTQPGLSKNVRTIEARLGLTVFERSTTGAIPTEIGTLLLRRGRQILLDLDAIHRDLNDELLSETGKVRIGAGPVPAPIIGAHVIARCQRDHPGIAIEMTIDHPAALTQRLEHGDIECFIGSCDGYSLPGGLAARVIQEVPLQFFVRRDHPLATKATLRLVDLAGTKLASVETTPHFVDWLAAACGGSAPEIAFQCNNYELLGQVVEDSDMVCCASPQVFARLQKRHDLVPLDFPDCDYRHRIHCVQPASRQLSRPAAKVVQLIEAALAGD